MLLAFALKSSVRIWAISAAEGGSSGSGIWTGFNITPVGRRTRPSTGCANVCGGGSNARGGGWSCETDGPATEEGDVLTDAVTGGLPGGRIWILDVTIDGRAATVTDEKADVAIRVVPKVGVEGDTLPVVVVMGPDAVVAAADVGVAGAYGGVRVSTAEFGTGVVGRWAIVAVGTVPVDVTNVVVDLAPVVPGCLKSEAFALVSDVVKIGVAGGIWLLPLGTEAVCSVRRESRSFFGFFLVKPGAGRDLRNLQTRRH